MKIASRLLVWTSLSFMGACIAHMPIAYAQTPPDPGLPGTFGVTQATYGSVTTNVSVGTFPVQSEFLGKIYYPNAPTGSSLPIVVLVHGRHAVCEDAAHVNSPFAWPCPAGYTSIPSYQGYDHIGTRLASQGFVVVSISVNAINAHDQDKKSDGTLVTADKGMNARAQLIQAHLQQLLTFNTTDGSPIGLALHGKLDFTRIGTMGHSRGGEAVITHYLYNKGIPGSPFTIKAIVPLAPTDFNRPIANNVPMMVTLPYCDGDVADLQGIHFYDDARYSDSTDQSAKNYLLVMGANHNNSNTVWTGGSGHAKSGDDWYEPQPDEDASDEVIPHSLDSQCSTAVTGNRRLSPVVQQNTDLAYLAAFYRFYLKGETAFAPYLTGAALAPPSSGLPAGWNATDVFMSYHAGASRRLDINTEATAAQLTTDSQGGAVSETLLVPYGQCSGTSARPDCLTAQQQYFQEPSSVDPTSGKPPGATVLKAGWAVLANLTNAIPVAKGNVTQYNALQLRVSVNFSDTLHELLKTSPNLNIALRDSNNVTSTNVDAKATSLEKVFYYPPGNTTNYTPKVVLNTLRIPLTAFGTAVDKTKITNVIITFPLVEGAVLLNDLAFVKDPVP